MKCGLTFFKGESESSYLFIISHEVSVRFSSYPFSSQEITEYGFD